MRCLQAAFIERDETCLEVVNHLIIELLKFAILDPGIPTPRLVSTNKFFNVKKGCRYNGNSFLFPGYTNLERTIQRDGS